MTLLLKPNPTAATPDDASGIHSLRAADNLDVAIDRTTGSKATRVAGTASTEDGGEKERCLGFCVLVLSGPGYAVLLLLCKYGRLISRSADASAGVVHPSTKKPSA